MNDETTATKPTSTAIAQPETDATPSPTKTETAPAPVPAAAPEPPAPATKADGPPSPTPGQVPEAPIALQTTQETPVAPTTTTATTPPAAAPSSSPTPAAPNAQAEPIDPAIADLAAMFPDFDHAILRSVLESVGFNQDRAIDVLLNMNDPTYQAPAGPNEAQRNQTELDEQFARNLYLEETQAEAAARAARGNAGWQPNTGQGQQQYPYQPRQGTAGGYGIHPQFAQQPPPGRHGPAATQEQSSGGDINFQEQFNKFAESGKKTFGTFFAKVKDKIKELDAPGPSEQQQQPPASYYPQPNQQQQQQPHPNSREIPPMPTMTPTSAPPAPALSPVPATTPRTSADLSRAGIVPKRPVSLVEVKQAPRPTDDDDDELEYVENPFEERRH